MPDANVDSGFFGDPGGGAEPTSVGNGSAMFDMSVLTAEPPPADEAPVPQMPADEMSAPAPAHAASELLVDTAFAKAASVDTAIMETAPIEPDQSAFGVVTSDPNPVDSPVADFAASPPAPAEPEAMPVAAAPAPLSAEPTQVLVDGVLTAASTAQTIAVDQAAQAAVSAPDRWAPPVDEAVDSSGPPRIAPTHAIDAPVTERWTPPAEPEVADPDPFASEPQNPNPFADAAPPARVEPTLEPAVSQALDLNALQGVAELDRIMNDRLVTMMYQPITSLLDDSVVGYEALARGPEGSPLATPAAMFQVAEEAGRVRDLDLYCQDQAVLQARDILLKSGHALFVNVESSVLSAAAFGQDPDAAQSFSSLLENITAACPVVLEISDLDDFSSNAELLGIAMWARKKGFRIALDDVGVSPRSLSVLPLIEPDVIKLQRGITNASPDANLGQLLSVLRSQSERTGAAVVCQDIESEEERQVALSFGATHVQGYAIGYPEELSEAPLRIRSLEPVCASWGEPCSTPFELVANSSQVRTCTEDLMLALTLDLERQAERSGNAVILSSFERTVGAPAAVASRYETLAETCGFVVALGEDLGEMQGVFSGNVEGSDPLSGERAIIVMTPQFSAALLGRMAGGSGNDRKYAYALIYDRGQVTRAARMLTGYVNL
jgi:EAL domain-containing protein (putative c-di-GMP-specific phosphodiesterase class I)